MKNSAITLIISSIAFLPFGTADPPCHLNEVGACVKNVIDFVSSLERKSLVRTSEDMDRFCKATDEMFTCLRDYMSRCMTPIQREIASLVAEGLLNLNKELCESTTSPIKTEFLNHAECLSKVAQGDGTSNNLLYFLAILENFITLPNVQKMNYVCCGYDKIYNDIRSDAANSCGEEATKAGEEFISLTITEIPSLLCKAFDSESEECTAVLPPTGSKPSDEFKENAIYRFAFTILKNFLE